MENNEKLSVEKLLEYRDFYNGLAEPNYNKNNHEKFYALLYLCIHPECRSGFGTAAINRYFGADHRS